jgi:YggT family protein
MISNATYFLLNTILNILTMMFLLRFLMQATKTPFHNPIGQIVMALTDFAVKPARKFIPSWKKNDLSTLALAFITQLLLQLLLIWLRPNGHVWHDIYVLSLFGIAHSILDLFFYAIFIQVILSWVNPHTPIAPALHSLTRPILGPVQKMIPPISGIDFSPFVAIILLQMINMSVLPDLEKSILSIF